MSSQAILQLVLYSPTKAVRRAKHITCWMLVLAALGTGAMAMFVAGAPHKDAGSANEIGRVSQKHLPNVFVWAWERPERLSFLNPAETGVAYLALTIALGPQRRLTPRAQPLEVPDGTKVIAVIRIEGTLEPLGKEELEAPQIASAIVSAVRGRGIAGMQIDFDATRSQREFYADLLREVRQRMPEGMPLSITALASWCDGDRWLSGLPIDDAVPMFFRMGPDERVIKQHFAHEPWPAPCDRSLGVSTDEPHFRARRGQRVFLFHPRAWDEEALRAAKEQFLP